MDNDLCIVKQEIDLGCGSPTQSSNTSRDSQSFASGIKRTSEQNEDYNQFVVQKLIKPDSSPGSPDHQCSSTSGIESFPGDSFCQENVKEELTKRMCLVCGDIASGFHYGVASCEACKAFFKRTIQGSIEYTCPANKNCEINKRRRKACQACRFHKCLLMGMLKEGVRLDRVRGGRQKYRRNAAGAREGSQLELTLTSSYPVQRLEDIKFLEVVALLEPNQFTAQCGLDLNNPYNGNASAHDAQAIFAVLSELYDKELVGIISWAKQVPGFHDLPLTDQMRLLQCIWTEIHTLMLVYRSVPYNGRLYFASDFWMDERIAEQCDAVELYNEYSLVAQRFDRLKVKKEEYYLIKALALSNCDIRLDDHLALKKIRDDSLSALNDCVLITRNDNAVYHQQQLLLLLPSLRQSDFIIRKFWKKLHREGSISMNTLFVQMLEPVSP